MNILILAKNFEKYTSGPYHNDIVKSIQKNFNSFVYGPGYSGYKESHDITKVIEISEAHIGKLNCVVVATSWDNDKSEQSVNPNPNIDLSELKTKKIYFLNKEYKKFEHRLNYIKQNKFDHVLTVNPNYDDWSKVFGINFVKYEFNCDHNMFRYNEEFFCRKYDFCFTGSLHSKYTDHRYLVKKQFFIESTLSNKTNKNLYNNLLPQTWAKDINIYWAEWGSKFLSLRQLVPSGKKYAELLGNSKITLCTLSAQSVLGTRFYEVMASGSIVLTPKTNLYNSILRDGENCIMFDSENIKEKIHYLLNKRNINHLQYIRKEALETAENYSYDKIIPTILRKLI